MLTHTNGARSRPARHLIAAFAAIATAAFAAAAPARAAEPGAPTCHPVTIQSAARDAVTPIWPYCGEESGVTFSVDSQPAHGTATARPGYSPGSWVIDYTPAPGYTGEDSFTYKGALNGAESDPQTVSITVVPPSPPECGNPEPALAHIRNGRNTTMFLYSGCHNLHAGGSDLTFQITQQPQHGTLAPSPGSSGNYVYTPAKDYEGSDSFSYKATNTAGQSTAAATQTIDVDANWNSAPQCFAPPTDVRAGSSREINLSCYDAEGDPVTLAIDRTGMLGTLKAAEPPVSGIPANPNSWTYTAPEEGDSDAFHYSATDDHGASSEAVLVNIHVKDRTYNTAPQCYASNVYEPSVETGGTIGIGTSCFDPEGDALTPVVTTPPAHGTLTPRKSTYGSFTYSYLEYKTTDSFVGKDTFAYKVTDVPPVGATPKSSEPVTASLQIKPPQPPTCYTQPPVTLRAGRERTFGLGCSTQNPVTQAQVHYHVTKQPAHGTLSSPLGEDMGWIVYKPNQGYTGADSFSYTAFNGAGTSNEVTQEITVSAAYNAAPQCFASSPYGAIRTGVAKQLFLYCWDEDGDPLTYAIVHGPGHGTLGTLHQPELAYEGASVTYTPSAAGADVIAFKASDGKAESAVTTLSLEVGGAGANTAPQCWDGSALRVAANGSLEYGADMVPCWDADDDKLTYEVVSGPAHGTLSEPNSEGARTYTPTDTTWAGEDSFTLKADDGRDSSATVPVKITVTAKAKFETAPATLPSGQPAKVQTFVDENGRSTVSVPSADVAQFADRCMPLDVGTDINPGAGSVANVKLTLVPADDSDESTVDMADGAGDHWIATLPCIKSGDLTVSYDLTEGGNTEHQERPLGGIVLIDPSGVVYDKVRYDAAMGAGKTEDEARSVAAIAGATVRLQRKTDDGVWGNVLSGDPKISPNVNPQVTKADGRYQWDVAAGTYRVVVSRDGYVTQTSKAVEIPPAVTDLHIAMVRTPVYSGPGDPPPPDNGGHDDPQTGGGGGGDTTAPPPTGPTAPAPAGDAPKAKTSTAVSCATLVKSKRAACEQAKKLDAAVAKCSKLHGAKKSPCVKKAKALSKCEPLKGRKKSACLKKANKIGRKR